MHWFHSLDRAETWLCGEAICVSNITGLTNLGAIQSSHLVEKWSSNALLVIIIWIFTCLILKVKQLRDIAYSCNGMQISKPAWKQNYRFCKIYMLFFNTDHTSFPFILTWFDLGFNIPFGTVNGCIRTWEERKRWTQMHYPAFFTVL